MKNTNVHTPNYRLPNSISTNFQKKLKNKIHKTNEEKNVVGGGISINIRVKKYFFLEWQELKINSSTASASKNAHA